MKNLLLLILLIVFFTQVNFANGVSGNKEPDQFKLSQNYPNPFNPVTNISFSIPEDTFVSLKVYNMLGNEVATVIDRKMEAGQHLIKFNGLSLSSGIYFYMLKTDDNIATKKLVLLK
jgi:Secretion system C-terminal sorting domain